MKKNNKSILILVTLIFVLICFLVNVELIITNIINYTNSFFMKLFPVSFITYLIVYMLIEYGLIQFMNHYLHINSCGLFLFILSFISGFPSGSKYIKLLFDKNLIDKDYANSLLSFTHFPNILFVLGTIKEKINNNTYTYYLLFSIVLSNFIILLFTKRKRININFKFTNNSFSKVLGNGIIYSIKTIILIYGTSLFFYLISTVILKGFTENLYLYVFLSGIFDLTNGVINCGLINNCFIKCLFILIFLSIGSISIHMQVNETIGDELDYLYFFKGRIIGTILAIVIFCLLFFI